MASIYASLYTADTLTHDCVGRYITKASPAAGSSSSSPAQLQLSSLLSHATYAQVWRSFISGLLSQYSLGHSMHLQPLGVIQPGKQRQRDASSGCELLVSTSRFLFHSAFLQSHGLQLSPASCSAFTLPPSASPSALHLNHSTLARLSSTSASTFSLALSHLMSRLCDVLQARREQLSIDLGVGLLIAMDGCIDFLFHDQRDGRHKGEEAASSGVQDARLLHRGAAEKAMTALVRAERVRRMKAAQPQPVAAEDESGSGSASPQHAEEEKETVSIPSTPLRVASHLRRLLDLSQPPPAPSSAADADGVPLALRNLRGQPPLQPLRDALAVKRGMAEEASSPLLSAASPSSLFTAKLPPLLDGYSRTQAAAFSPHAGGHVSASSKIAAHYTLQAVDWQIDSNTQRLVRLSAQRPRAEQPQLQQSTPWLPADGPLSARAADKSSALYEYYLSHLDDGVVAAFKPVWLKQATSLLSTDISLLSPPALDAAMSALLSEIQADYVQAMKRCILDYVLLSPAEQTRLSIALPPAPLNAAWLGLPSLPSAPLSWRPGIQRSFRSLSGSLCLNNPAMLFLLEAFTRYEHLSLFSRPSPSSLPLQLKQWEASQRQHVQEVVATLRSGWLAEVETALTAYAREQNLTDENSAHFFDAVAAVMAAQLRSVLQASVQQLHDFVTAYSDSLTLSFAEAAAPSLSSLLDPSLTPSLCPPLFANRSAVLKAKDGSLRIELELPAQELSAAFERVFEQLLHCVDGIPRVELRIFNILNASRSLQVAVTGAAGAGLDRMRAAVQDVLSRTRAGCDQLLSLYSPYAFLLEEDRQVAAFLAVPHPLAEHQQRIASYRAVRDELAAQVAVLLPLPVHVMAVDCRQVHALLLQRADECIEAIGADIAARNVQRNVAILAAFKQLSVSLLKRPSSTQELVDLQQASLQFKSQDRSRMRAECEQLRDELLFLLEQRCLVETAVLEHAGATFDWLLKLNRIVGESEALIETERGRMEHWIEERVEAHNALAAQLAATVRQCDSMSEKSKMAEYVGRIAGFKEQIAAAERDISLLLEQERMLGMSPSEVHPLHAVKAYLAPFDSLWTLASSWHRQHSLWMRGSVLKLNAQEVKAEVQQMSDTALRLQAELEAAPEVRKVAEYLHTELQHMQSHMPLLAVLSNAGMRERHWAELSATLGFSFIPDSHTTLARALELGLAQHVEAMSAVSEAASKEWHVESSVAGMKAEWTNVSLALRPQHATFVINADSLEDCAVMLDEHQVRLSTLKASPYAAPFMADIRALEGWLQSTSAVLQLASSLQSVWLYLAPLFSGADIAQQMPGEGALFTAVDTAWKGVMAAVSADSHLLAVSAIPHLHSTLSEALHQLETVQCGLHHYLESKRLYFPRFFFLSNDELLSLLSETGSARAALPHMKKCFDGVSSLAFNAQEEIVSLISSQGEVAHLVAPVRPAEARGAVERWLRELELQMKESVKDYARRALTAYSDDERLDWALSWPAQTVLTCNSMQFTAQVTRAIQHTGRQALQALLVKGQAELQQLVDRARSPLRPLDRTTLSSLIVMDVQARDVLQQLIDAAVSDVSHFSWQSQLRYYWNHLDDSVEVRMMQCSIPYQCEYIGNTPRLVVTPLTDRCFRTLVTAIQLNMGGATVGPAGTGKSESIKELAKAVGVQCLTFNCSDSLDVQSMSKLLKGLCCTGAWSCLDEFNRIALPVLSVIAQQVATITQAKAAGLTSFSLDGATISLQPSTSIFITMNPQYSARSPMPDNLKRQFRCCCMTAPDSRLIAQLLLFSHGFTDADRLSRKVVAVMSLCAAVLGRQPHYDWGLRAVKSLVNTCVRMKAQQPELEELTVLRRAVTAVNLPKLVPEDVLLFDGVMTDLFGREQAEGGDSDGLRALVVSNCKKRQLQPTPALVAKVLQLYDTVRIRHGVVLVGRPYAGKTTAIQLLAAALNELALSDTSSANLERGVEYTTLNPKAVSIADLYGSYLPTASGSGSGSGGSSGNGRDFTPGLLKGLFDSYAAGDAQLRHWVVFDGPVDALWVESLNTALDDSRKLCLPDGHVVHLPQLMSALFEVHDLAAASPATVSRCGMVHMPDDAVGWRSLVSSHPLAYDCRELFELFVEPLWQAVSGCQMLSQVGLMNAVEGCIQLLAALATPLPYDSNRQDDVHACFLFALTWSLGAAVDSDGRPRVDACIREVCRVNNCSCFPSDDSCFAYSYSLTRHAFVPWSSLLQPHAIPVSTPFHSLVIPTASTACYQSLLALLTQAERNTLLVGLTGSGKSVVISECLTGALSAYEALTLHFSAQTSAQSTQASIDARLERRRKGVYGASQQRRCVVVVEDLNLPALDAHGSQPVNELLRQQMEHGGWFGLKERSWRQVEGLSFIAAMAPSGGGRQPVSERVLRHFHTLCLPPLGESTVTAIFTAILSWHFSTQQFVPSIAELTSAIVAATCELYRLVSTQLLPMPGRTHYTYNVRDVSRVFQGLLLSPAAQFPAPEPFIRLWIHEVHRVFCDRLVDDEDSQRFLEWVRELTQARFHCTFPQLMAHLDQDHDGLFTAMEVRQLFFGDYMSRHRQPRLYSEITDLKRLHTAWSIYLEDYNAETRRPMHLTLFRFAIEHVSRIARILREDRGHALLIGVGGSGKQSLTRLAASVMDYELRSIELTREYAVGDWKHDLRQILRACVQAAHPTVLLLSDAQLLHGCMLEDVSGLLQVGSVPNLWPHDELAEVCEMVREDCKRDRQRWSGAEPSQHELFDYFTARVRRQLHVVLCMSPAGPMFADRLRMFPALLNCCHLDYYAAWPHDALFSVARDFLREHEWMDAEEATRDACVHLCIFLHRDVERMAADFMAELQRPCYVTPTSYLELVTTFKTLLAFKRKETSRRRQRYLTGLEKLNASEKEVLTMQAELEQLQPVLERTRAETSEMMELVEQEAADAAVIRSGVAQEEKVANEAALTAKSIEAECGAELAQALPLLDAANAALDTLTPQEISELKAMRAPPKGVRLVCEALCIMKKVAPARLPDPKNNGNFILDWWEPSKRQLLSDPRLLRSLTEYEKDDVSPAVIKKIRAYLAMPDFELSKLRAVSTACASIAQWIYAIEAYDRVIKQIQPKREALTRARDECAAMEASLHKKQDELQQVEQKMAGLTATLSGMQAQRDELEGRMANCSLKIDRANILISRLGGERERWIQAAQALAERYEHLTGDMLLSSGVIAYLGPFKASYRVAAVQRWSAKCRELGIPLLPSEFSLASVLGDAVQTRRWVIEGLPNDGFSIDNALIISKSRRWPLMIDPQGQAGAWIRAMERDNGLLVVKAGDDYYAAMQAAITAGSPCLLQDVSEQLDPCLDSLLLKQVYKKAGSKWLRFRGAELPYHDSFRLFLTTKLKNPHYLPEVAVHVTLLNFIITEDGLRDQLLGAVVKKERPELETERHRLVLASASNCSRLKELEEKILQVLSSSRSDILNDEHAIDVLSASKAIVNEIEDKQAVASRTELQLESSRAAYLQVATHAAVLFFAVLDLAPVQPSYQFSLSWFVARFQSAIDSTDRHEEALPLRIRRINQSLTATVCHHVCRALFQQDRLTFALLVAARLLQAKGELQEAEWRFLLTPHVALEPEERVWNCSRWLGQKGWDDLVRLCRTCPRNRLGARALEAERGGGRRGVEGRGRVRVSLRRTVPGALERRRRLPPSLPAELPLSRGSCCRPFAPSSPLSSGLPTTSGVRWGWSGCMTTLRPARPSSACCSRTATWRARSARWPATEARQAGCISSAWAAATASTRPR